MPGNHDEALRDYLQDTNIELGSNMCAPRRLRGSASASNARYCVALVHDAGAARTAL